MVKVLFLDQMSQEHDVETALLCNLHVYMKSRAVGCVV